MNVEPLTLERWLTTMLIGASVLPIGFLVRLYPVEEDEAEFFTVDDPKAIVSTAAPLGKAADAIAGDEKGFATAKVPASPNSTVSSSTRSLPGSDDDGEEGGARVAPYDYNVLPSSV